MSSVIIDNSPVSTPAHEWAQETTSALSNRVHTPSERVASESNATTPGQELPGSFPREYDRKEPKDALEPIVANIPSIDTAREEATKILGSVGESVKNYLPESVTRVIREFISIFLRVTHWLIIPLAIGIAPEIHEKRLDAPLGTCVVRTPEWASTHQILDPTSTAKPSDVESDVSGHPLSGSAQAAVGTTAAVSGVATALNLGEYIRKRYIYVLLSTVTRSDPSSNNKLETGANDPIEPAISGVATRLKLGEPNLYVSSHG
jgi:hypothetical protein